MLLCSGRPKQTAVWHERSDSFAPGGAHHPLHGASGSHCNNGKLVPFYITQFIILFTSRSNFSLRHNSEEALQAFNEIFVIFALTCFKNTRVFHFSLRSSIKIISICRFSEEEAVVHKEGMKLLSVWLSPTTELKKPAPSPTAELRKAAPSPTAELREGILVLAPAANRTGRSLLVASTLCLFSKQDLTKPIFPSPCGILTGRGWIL